MHCKYNNATKQEIVEKYQNGSSVTTLSNDNGIARSTIPFVQRFK